MKKITPFLLTLVFLLSLQFTFAQSISGNMNAGKDFSLGFGNVDIFKGDEKIASILTDREGNFNIKLDTGYYRLEFQYAGYEKMIREIHVTGDEVDDFALTGIEGYTKPSPASSPYERRGTEMSGASGKSIIRTDDYDMKVEYMISDMGMPTFTGDRDYSVGQLTAGEINDFSKWELWKDISNDHLAQYKRHWDLHLSKRYTFQVTNQDNSPIQGVLVQLVGNNDKVIFSAITDNTGKAELWGDLYADNQNSAKLKTVLKYDGKSYTIKNPSTFENGINSYVIQATCAAFDNVDIAFVVDATGSMGDEIEYLKMELNNVIFQSKNNLPELTFNYGSIFYRDHGDAYLTRRSNFTTVLSETVDFISAQRAGGGGDYEEALEIALLEALDSLNWSENARARILFVVLDAPAHNTPDVLAKLKEVVAKASEMGVRIVPLVASGINRPGEYLLRTLALGTNGTYVYLTDNSGIGGKHLEPITDEHHVETLNEILIRIIETYTFIPECETAEDFELIDKYLKEDYADEIIIDVWPNPATDFINVKINKDVQELFVTDLTGKIIYRFENVVKDRALKINVANLSKGMYLISFSHEDKVYARKFVK